MDVQLPRQISRIVFRCSEQTKTELLSKMPIHEGSMLSDELLQQAREAARTYSERLAILVRQSIREEEYFKSGPEMRKAFIPPAVDDGVKVVIWDRAIPPERIRVEGGEQNSRLVEKTTPTHSGEEVAARAVVKLAIVTAKDGRVLEVDPLAGPAALISPAIDAVRRWKYQPTLLNGRPVEVVTTVEVRFPPEE